MPIFVWRKVMVYGARPMAMVEEVDQSAYSDGTPRGYYAKHEIDQETYNAVISGIMSIKELEERFPLPPDAKYSIPIGQKAQQSAD